MKPKLLFLSLLLAQILSAQTFTEVALPPAFDNVAEGSIAFTDVDGDNDVDVLITGGNSQTGRITKLFLNDGLGNFSEVSGTTFDNVLNSSIAFLDVNGDHDPDLLLTGMSSFGEPIAKLYFNDGQGNFAEVPGTPFEGVERGSIAFADVDGDNDPDVLITGLKDGFLNEFISKLYLNNGVGKFTEMPDTPFAPTFNSSIAFADVDGDNDADVLITGSIDALGIVAASILYLNDGQGNFTEMPDVPFEDVDSGSIAFADVDGDDDPDILITGINNLTERISKLYINDGQGTFSEVPGTPFDGVRRSAVAFSDVDGDNDSDVLITGADSFGASISKLYTNDGQGNFMEVSDTPFAGVFFSAIAFADVDGDNDPDVLITGASIADGRISKLYINDSVVSTDEALPAFNLDLKPYPNPTGADHLILDFKTTQNGFITLKIYASNGALLRQQKMVAEVGPQTISVDISGLSAGNYFIQLDHGKKKGVTRFIVP